MIRVADRGDADGISEVEARCGGSWSAASAGGQLALDTTHAWVTEGAHVLTSVVADEAEVVLLAVVPERRRQGVGRALLREAEVAWRALGVTRAWLEVRAGNLAALALYGGEGWETVGRRPRYYPDGEDAVLMRKVLT